VIRRWRLGALAWIAALGCQAAAGAPASRGSATAGSPTTATRAWLAAPPPAVLWLGPLLGQFGRGDAPELLAPGGVAGAGGELRDVAVWPAGGSAARAVVAGSDALAVVDVDAAAPVWRAASAGRVVAVVDGVVVIADASGLRGVDEATGSARWAAAGAAAQVITGGRIVVGMETGSGAGSLDVLFAADGVVHERMPMPAGIAASDVLATCASGDAFARVPAVAATRSAAAQPAGLARVVGGKLAWRAPVAGAIAAVDACGPSVLATVDRALVAVARDGGAITGRVDGVRGWWPARDGGADLEIATTAGVWRRARDLADAGVLEPELPVLGELLASRGDRRLVRATPRTAALLDRDGVRAILPLAEATAVLGDVGVAAGGASLRVRAIPRVARRGARVPLQHAGIAIAAELRDLPPAAPLDDHAAFAAGGDDGSGDLAIAIDPEDPSTLYARVGATLARASLTARAWPWRADGGCTGAIAVARGAVVCAAGFGLHALSPADGARLWAALGPGTPPTRVLAAGDLVVAFAGDRAAVYAAGDGRDLGSLASDDGGPLLAAPVALAPRAGSAASAPSSAGDDELGTTPALAASSSPRGPFGGAYRPPAAAVAPRAPTTLLFAVTHGRLVAFVPDAALAPLWSLAIAGTATAVTAAGDGVVVELEGGDAYRVTADARVIALPALNTAWRAAADTLAATCDGGPIPPNPMPAPPPPPPPVPAQPSATTQLPSDFESPPPLATPWPPPPPMLPSYELSLFEPTGGFRARADYALVRPVALAPRIGARAPFVIASADARELLVVDPQTGDPRRRVTVASPAAPFSVAVGGVPITGVVVTGPLRVVTF
jgi:hypothetical protein